jgi:16S rRNA (uracil1498-N3)-methyltransferase
MMAELPHFFIPKDHFQDDAVIVTGAPLHHLRQVLRLKEGDLAIFLDGSGGCCRVRLENLAGDSARALVLERWQETETALPIHLLQGLPKGDKFDLILQKGTELGITSFQPVLTRRSIPQPDAQRFAKRYQRWHRIVSEAARQSRRSFLPRISPPEPLSRILPSAADNLRLVLWEAGARPLASVLPELRPQGVSLLVGPEGGFAADEIALIEERGYQPVHMGPRILRTETAGLAAAGILQYLYGDLNRAPHESEEIP